MNDNLQERIYLTIKGEARINTNELGDLPLGKEMGTLQAIAAVMPIGVTNVANVIDFAKKSDGKYFRQMGEALEKYIQTGKIEPVIVENMRDVHRDITETIWKLQEIKEVKTGWFKKRTTYKVNMTDGTVFAIQTYWRLVAEYVAFKEKKQT